MPRLGPIKRDDLIRYLHALGFDGPFSGTKHQFMTKEELRLRLPNPHHQEISKELLSMILKEADISRESWKNI